MTFFFYFKCCTALIRHQRLLGANSWGALDGPLEAREALRVDDPVSRKGLAHSAAFFSVDNLHNLSPFLLLLYINLQVFGIFLNFSPSNLIETLMDRPKS